MTEHHRMKRRISFSRGLTGKAIRPRARIAVDSRSATTDAALSPCRKLFRLDALGIDEARPVLDLASELGMHGWPGNHVRRDVELGEALAQRGIAHYLGDHL